MMNADKGLGILFLVVFPFYGVGIELLESKSSPKLGFILVMLNSIVVFIIGLVINKLVNTFISKVYLISRIIEAILLALSCCLLYTNDNVDRVYYQVAMVALAVGSVPLFDELKRNGRIPVWLGKFGVLAYIMLGVGIGVGVFVSEEMELYLMILGMMFEITFAIWLLVHGFQAHGNKND